MSARAYAVLFEQVIDEFNQWNFKYIADAAIYNRYHSHVANTQLRTVTVTDVVHALGFDPALVPRSSADRRRHLHAVA